MITSLDKALVPGIVILVLGGLSFFGIDEMMTVKEAATLVVTGVLVYFVPNK